jgi:F0F1-type ATP synthase membrane subunit b/b'
MSPINPSHFVALSFLILVGVLIWKRFFNINEILDAEINTIKERIQNAAHDHEMARIHLKDMGAKIEAIESKIAEIIDKGRIACETLALSLRDEIAVEIAQKQTLHALQAKHMDEQFRKMYQDQLISHILLKLVDHLKAQTNDSFHEQQLGKSLGLLSTLKIAA